MKFTFPSVFAALALIAVPASSLEANNSSNLHNTHKHRQLADDEKTPEAPPHNGCEFMLKDQEPPHPMLVGEDFEKITTTNYKVENEAGPTAAECRNGMSGGYPCNNVDMLSMISVSVLNDAFGGSDRANDIWGWTDPDSKREFALIGMFAGTAFVEITDPVNPIYLGGLRTQGSGSSWRDVKTLDHYAVIGSEEGGHGIQIFDLRELLDAEPNTSFSVTARYTGVGSSHNVFVNEASKTLYIVGQSGCSGGLHMVDMSDPLNPTQSGCFSADGYTHDVQCVIYAGPDSSYRGKEICFASNEDTVTIVDVTNKSNPIQISRTGYGSSRYTHQGWLTEDHAYFIFNDELDESRNGVSTSTHLMDVSALSRPVYKNAHIGRTRAIDHNNYVLGKYVYQANYRAGLNILEMKDLSSTDFDEAGYFDIYPGSDATAFNGAWSTYPYFPSGSIVVSGIEQGLFVLKFTGGSQPTSAPTPDGSGCPDADSTAFFEHNGKRRSCSWNRARFLCKKKDFMPSFCPHLCEACDYQCKDYTGSFRTKKAKNAKVWTCETLKQDRKYLSKCLKERFYTTCRETCMSCL